MRKRAIVAVVVATLATGCSGDSPSMLDGRAGVLNAYHGPGDSRRGNEARPAVAVCLRSQAGCRHQ